jgi:hypothetical protein
MVNNRVVVCVLLAIENRRPIEIGFACRFYETDEEVIPNE